MTYLLEGRVLDSDRHVLLKNNLD